MWYDIKKAEFDLIYMTFIAVISSREVKLQFILEQTTKAQSCGRGIVLLFL
jgi:hypothetical protein